ncbi:hypothetical protein [Prauserella shujinwangii]|uniref:hypothetical protein n=1 Tax=Prauserella shujinwangii TaxID=1453103 RepID=UPI001FEC1C9A|nr:hypothetical protein [Prauserella shujinwangii]
MRQRVKRGRRPPSLTWKVLGVASLAGLCVVLAAWWAGPSLFSVPEPEQRRVVTATVTLPAECTTPDAEETVRFELDGTTRDGTLSGCGHDQDEQVRIAVPSDAGGSGLVEVSLAGTAPGIGDLRRPAGLFLLVLSCAAGGVYAYLVVRGPRLRTALA